MFFHDQTKKEEQNVEIIPSLLVRKFRVLELQGASRRGCRTTNKDEDHLVAAASR